MTQFVRAGDVGALEQDPALLSGQMASGVGYALLPRERDAGQLSVGLLVRVGSVCEEEAESGYAFLIKELATRGSKRGSARADAKGLEAQFAAAGVSLASSFNSYTTLDHSFFWLTIPADNAAAREAAVLLLGDVVGRLTLADEELDRAKRLILEKGAGLSADYRLFSTALDRILPGSAAGLRPPWGRADTIRAASGDAVRSFYARWYTPSNATLIAVGDFEPHEMMVEMAGAFEQGLGGAPARPGNVAMKEKPARRAVVAVDEQQAGPLFEYLVASPPAGPVVDAAGARRELARGTAAWLLERRVEARMDEERASATKVVSAVTPFAGAADIAVLAVSSTEDGWDGAARAVVEEIGRAVEHGFTARELELARTRAAAHGRERAAEMRMRPPRQALLETARSIALGEVVRSPAQVAGFAAEAAGALTLEELDAAAREAFDPSSAALLLTHSDAERAPSERALLEAADAALGRELAAVDDGGRATTLMDGDPGEGRVAEFSIHPPSGVVAATLENGVAVRHRAMGEPPGRVTVRVSIPGGWIDETAQTRGLTAAAAGALERPATRTRSAAELADLLEARAIALSVRLERDLVSVTLESSSAELEGALRAAHLILAEPVVAESSLERWRGRALSEALAAERQPGAALNRLIADALYPEDEPRGRLLSAARIREVDASSAQRWLDRMVRESPLEVAIVGDVERAPAMQLAKTYVGTLVKRDAAPLSHDDPRRLVRRSVGPIDVRAQVRSPDPHAVTLVAIPAADARDAQERTALDAAAHVLSSRLSAMAQESETPVLYPRAVNLPGEAFPGFGMFYAVATAPPGEAGAVVEAMRGQIERLAAEGPTAQEMESAVRDLRVEAERRLAGASHWAELLSTLTARERSIDGAVLEPERLAGLSASEVREAVASRAGPDGRLSVIVTPVGRED